MGPSASGPPRKTFRPGWGGPFWMAMSLLTVGTLNGAFKLPILQALLFGIPFAAISIYLKHRRACEDQRIRDARAAGILEQLRRGETPPFSLYLRTFGVTGALSTGHRTSETTSPLLEGPMIDLETILGMVVERDAPLLALGRPGEHLGAGRIVTEESSWREEILLLAKQAAAIFVIPSGRPGTAWEMGMILEHHFWEKSVFLMPPGLSDEFRETWDSDRERLAALGLTIPKYLRTGMVFTVDRWGQVNGRADLRVEKIDLKTLAKTIDLARADARATPDVDVRGFFDGPELPVGTSCPNCGGGKVRPPTPRELKARKALIDDGISDRATCADCGTAYRRSPSNGGVVCFFLSVVTWAILAVIVGSGVIERSMARPILGEILTLAIGLLFLGAVSLAFPAWCVGAVAGWIRPKDVPPGGDRDSPADPGTDGPRVDGGADGPFPGPSRVEPPALAGQEEVPGSA